ncbi:unnamed protein product [Medioppia subpectinata]|uniref:Uncharacterized protein n=1 Tax=Medioppia subpectinata TaxID=1979941 RepID=A0A7R9KQV6_9ACAR|nr:unnamed protein product [Medioppia subpectinata]CAG2107028.1 unnamed protein product [Medioppia subpectinata]
MRTTEKLIGKQSLYKLYIWFKIMCDVIRIEHRVDCKYNYIFKNWIIVTEAVSDRGGLVILYTNFGIAHMAPQQSPTHSNQPLRVVADLTKTRDIERLVGEIVDKFGQLDAMITFANSYPLLNITDPNLMDVWDQTLRADLRATAELFHLTYLLLEKARGSATVVATIAGVAPNLPIVPPKLAFNIWLKNLALELGAKGVRVNTINVGAITPDGTNLGNPVLALMEKRHRWVIWVYPWMWPKGLCFYHHLMPSISPGPIWSSMAAEGQGQVGKGKRLPLPTKNGQVIVLAYQKWARDSACLPKMGKR